VHNIRRLKHVCTFAGHNGCVKCIDMNTEFNLIVSGGIDRTVCVWDYRTKRLVRMLNGHRGPLIAVSIGPLSGFIATLTETQLRLFNINGETLSFVDFSDVLCLNGSISSVHGLCPPSAILVTPCADWQDGVVIVTGHNDGQFYLWRLRDVVSDSTALLIEPTIRQLFVSFTPTKTHRSSITVLKLHSTVSLTKSKQRDMVVKSFDESRSLDLFVGDADGFVSRWSPCKLDQLQHSDLQNIASFGFK
jgi:WD40 repeat protein